MSLSTKETALVNGWQRNFPLVSRPYAQIASQLDITEAEVISILTDLNTRGIITRVGAVVRPNTVGVSSLVAMAIPPQYLDEVAAMVCDEDCVNHNYERDDNLNLWFVVATSDREALQNILSRIESKSGYETLTFPLKKAYHINLGFNI